MTHYNDTLPGPGPGMGFLCIFVGNLYEAFEKIETRRARLSVVCTPPRAGTVCNMSNMRSFSKVRPWAVGAPIGMW